MVIAIGNRTIPIYYEVDKVGNFLSAETDDQGGDLDMAQFESILGDQSGSSESSQNTSQNKQNKQNNVADFNSQSAKSAAPMTDSGRSTSQSGSGSVAGAATATARTFYDQAKETAGQAYEAVTDKAATKIDEQKSTLSEGLSTVADSVRQVSENLGSSQTDSGLAEAAAKYTDTAARRIEDIAGYFETHGVRDMARDLENFARRNPAIFFGAAFGLGLLAARFFKSSPAGYGTSKAGRKLERVTDTSHQLEAPGESPEFSAKPV